MQKIYKYLKGLNVSEKICVIHSLIFLIFLIDLAFYDIFLAVKIILLVIIVEFIAEKIENLIKKGT